MKITKVLKLLRQAFCFFFASSSASTAQCCLRFSFFLFSFLSIIKRAPCSTKLSDINYISQRYLTTSHHTILFKWVSSEVWRVGYVAGWHFNHPSLFEDFSLSIPKASHLKVTLLPWMTYYKVLFHAIFFVSPCSFSVCLCLRGGGLEKGCYTQYLWDR